jgi:predicted dehydrogenase
MTEQRKTTSPTRRDFLATAAATGTALATGLGLVSNVHAAGSDEIKVGLIGCGGRGSQACENVLASAPGVKIVALGDVFAFRTRDCRESLKQWLADPKKNEAAKKYGNTVDLPDDRLFVGLDAYEKVLGVPEVNYVILATPPGFRPPHLEAAVAAGKNIFTEKPVGVDGPGIRKVLAAYEEAQKKGLAIVAGTQRRHQLGYVETMKRLHDRAIGDITALRCYWNGSGIWFHPREELAKYGIPDSDLAYQLYNWYHFVWLCGDHIVEQHVHNLDVCNWAMGTHPVKAVGVGGRHCRPAGDPQVVGTIFDQFAVDFEYPGGVHMLSMCQHLATCDSNVSEAMVGTKGVCLTRDAGKRDNGWKIQGKNVLTREQAEASVNPYVQEHTDLIASIRSGKPVNELKNVAESTLTAILGRMSTYTGKTVTWDKALHSQLDTMPKELTWNMKLDVGPVPVPGKTPLV